MPIIPDTTYPGPPTYQFNGHLQTIVPSLFRKIETLPYERERLILQDGDFVDLDWLDQQSQQLLLLTHGLEGNSDRTYVKGMARFFAANNWDVLAWNCRSCSGEMNRAPRLYHHGEIEDIDEVLMHALTRKKYQQVVLIGFSMGGAITLKYLGSKGNTIPEVVSHGIAFSTPCDLKESVDALEIPGNRFYKKKFFRSLSEKVKQKAAQYPGLLEPERLQDVRLWRDFDEFFSAPLTGNANAAAFYEQASCKNYMAGTAVPLLLVNAQNDPLLTAGCTPLELGRKHPLIHIEETKKGGHVGFAVTGEKHYWSEKRALEFVK